MESVFVINAWMGGALVGGLVILHFLIMGNTAGCSVGYASTLTRINGRFDIFGEIDHTKFFFILGLPLGGFVFSTLFGSGFNISYDMGMYERILPEEEWMKTLFLFAGGGLLGFGARMGSGCTTGHALVGGALLHWPSILAAGLFFVSATLTTWLLFVWL